MNNDLINRAELPTVRIEIPKRLDDETLEIVEALVAAFKAVIDSAPAVDAVEVVRCKDCKHWGIGYGVETENIKACCFASYMVGKNGYCVYGERKMDAEVNDVD